MLQTPAEILMIEEISAFLRPRPGKNKTRLLNIGAGNSLSIETALAAEKLDFISDRLDLYAPDQAGQKFADKIWLASLENCPEIPSAYYDLCFANYVLEHIRDLTASAGEIGRILKPGGLFIVTTPNPAAPEFRLARHTPFWFHKLVRGQSHEAFETFYAYQDIPSLEQIFIKAGFQVKKDNYYPFTFGYLHAVPLISWLSRFYDWLVKASGQKKLMGNAIVIFKKN